MSPKETTALRIDTALLDAMRRVKATDGIPVTTQFEMSAREWLRKRGIVVEPAGKRATGPRRSRTRRAR